MPTAYKFVFLLTVKPSPLRQKTQRSFSLHVLAAWLAALGMRIRFIQLTAEHQRVINLVLSAMLRAGAGPVAFYDADGEVIRFTSSPTLPILPHLAPRPQRL